MVREEKVGKKEVSERFFHNVYTLKLHIITIMKGCLSHTGLLFVMQCAVYDLSKNE